MREPHPCILEVDDLEDAADSFAMLLEMWTQPTVLPCKRPVPFVKAAKNLICAVVEANDGERQVEPLESLARRMMSWEKFKQAAKQWCERHSAR